MQPDEDSQSVQGGRAPDPFNEPGLVSQSGAFQFCQQAQPEKESWLRGLLRQGLVRGIPEMAEMLWRHTRADSGPWFGYRFPFLWPSTQPHKSSLLRGLRNALPRNSQKAEMFWRAYVELPESVQRADPNKPGTNMTGLCEIATAAVSLLTCSQAALACGLARSFQGQGLSDCTSQTAVSRILGRPDRFTYANASPAVQLHCLVLV